MLVNKNFRVGKNRGEKPIKIGLLNKIRRLFTCFWLHSRSIFGYEKHFWTLFFTDTLGRGWGLKTSGTVLKNAHSIYRYPAVG
jgi:hypothetical protein